METKVAGVSFKNDETGRPRQEILGKLYDDYWTENKEDQIAVELRPEPGNPVDPRAIAVFVMVVGKDEFVGGRVGFVPKEDLDRVHQGLRTGRLTARVKNMSVAKRGSVSMALTLMLKKEAE